MQQSLSKESMATVTANLEQIVTDAGKPIAVTLPKAGMTFMTSDSTFSFFMSVKIKRTDYLLIQIALAKQWSIEYTGISVTILSQESYFSFSG